MLGAVAEHHEGGAERVLAGGGVEHGEALPGEGREHPVDLRLVEAELGGELRDAAAGPLLGEGAQDPQGPAHRQELAAAALDHVRQAFPTPCRCVAGP
nr:hypothetical protein DA06_10275 [Georgenia sp. SUBG003]